MFCGGWWIQGVMKCVCVGRLRQRLESVLMCFAWLACYEMQLSGCCNSAEFPLWLRIIPSHWGNHDPLTLCFHKWHTGTWNVLLIVRLTKNWENAQRCCNTPTANFNQHANLPETGPLKWNDWGKKSRKCILCVLDLLCFHFLELILVVFFFS